MKIAVVEGQTLSSGVRTVVGSIALNDLADRISTPWRDARTKEGYQRRPTVARINKLVSDIRKNGVDIPTAILLNARDESWCQSIENQSDGCLAFDLEKYAGTFSVVDGQHRVTALKELLDEDPDEYGLFRLQFVMMLGASNDQELEQFYIVNSTAKSVKTDLALDLLKQRALQDGKVMDNLIESGQDWKVRAQGLVERLADHSRIWRRRIRLANEPKGVTTIPSASYVTSLKKFLVHPYIQGQSEEDQYRLIESFWSGIEDAMPEPFEYPNSYTLMKGIGVWAMHEIFPTVIEVIRSRGDSLFEPRSHEAVVQPMLENLEGENASAEVVRGHEFWLTAPKGGAAGSYSSSAGKRVLASKLKQLLPKPEIE